MTDWLMVSVCCQQVPQRVSRTVPKMVCDDGGSYGAQGGQGGNLLSTVRSKVDYSFNLAVSLPNQTFTEYHENEGSGNYFQ